MAISTIDTASISAAGITTAKIADANVTTAKIAANAVTAAKLAREGSSGQVLTSNGAGSDPSYQTISTTPTTAQVISAYAGAAAGAVGTYVISNGNSSYTALPFGGTIAGSQLIFVGGASYGLSGTWRFLGGRSDANQAPSLYFRIS